MAVEDLATNQAGTATSSLTVLGTPSSDDVSYGPLGSQSGELAIAGFRAGLDFTGVGGTFLVDPQLTTERSRRSPTRARTRST
jgi:hypothetical protein